MTDAPAESVPDLHRAARRVLRQRSLGSGAAFVASAAYPAAASALVEVLGAAVAELEPVCLGLYWPMRSEPNAASRFAADARTVDFSLALPYARRSPATMEFHHWDGTPPSVVDGCGIGSSDGPSVQPDVVVVPCVGFTAAGHRLGYGGGYYDRWLAAHPGVTAIGVAWSSAEIDADVFGAQAHDIPLSFIVTEKGIR